MMKSVVLGSLHKSDLALFCAGPHRAWLAGFTFGKTPAEFQGTLYAIPDVVTDGRLSQHSVPMFIGREYVQKALNNAPRMLSLTSFPSTTQIYREKLTNVAVQEVNTFFQHRRSEVINMTKSFKR